MNTAQNTSSSPNFKTPDFEGIIARVKEIITNPDQAWDKIKNEPTSIADIYKNYLVVLLAIGNICTWIKGSFIGYSFLGFTYRDSIFGGLAHAVLFYCLQLVMVYVVATVLEKLAPKFEGSTTLDNTFKLVAYSMTPSCIASVGVLVPGIGFLLLLVGGIYGIFVFFKGLPKFVQIPESKKFLYIAASVACMIVVGFIAGVLVNIIVPIGYSGAPNLDYNGNHIDLNNWQDNLKKLEKSFPKP